MFNLTDLPILDTLLNDLLELEESNLLIDDSNPSLDDYLTDLEDYQN